MSEICAANFIDLKLSASQNSGNPNHNSQLNNVSDRQNTNKTGISRVLEYHKHSWLSSYGFCLLSVSNQITKPTNEKNAEEMRVK